MNDMFLYRLGQKRGGGSDGGSGGGVATVKIKKVEDWDNEYVTTVTTDSVYSDAKAAFMAGDPVFITVSKYVIRDGAEIFKGVEVIANATYNNEDDYIEFNYGDGRFSTDGLEMASNG